ncbi:MAG: MBL fold metallo-hydrolase, partial [Clostridia bacterium]|nr:MBL fold metallo-hydrolase [Clostridia bacterium]
DYVLCTHPHSDHIGGMAQVIESLEVGQIYMPKAVHTSKTYENLLLAIQEKGLSIVTAKAGRSFSPEEGVEVRFLAPVSDYYEEMNDYSAVVRITYGENAFLFTGDAETLSESQMLEEGSVLSANVLKVGHHGSNSSSHQAFLDAVLPEYAIISCGTDNSYGHPHKEVVERLERMGITTYRTDVSGTVAAISDGTDISIWTEE